MDGRLGAEEEFIRRKIQITTYSVNILGDYKLLLWGDGQAAPTPPTPPPPTPLLLLHEDIKHTENAYIKRTARISSKSLLFFLFSPPPSHLVCLPPCSAKTVIWNSIFQRVSGSCLSSLSLGSSQYAHDYIFWLALGPRPKEVQYSRWDGATLKEDGRLRA